MNTTQIAARLDEANKAYRNGSPIMSDAAYDALEDELRKLAPNHPHFATVGAAPTGGSWPKVQHSIPMGSLKKVQFDADASKAGGDGHAELRSWWPNKPCCLTHKLDGISINLVYKDRKLVQAITRGDGSIGEDITRNVLLMEGAVRMLPKGVPNTVYVRGEIVCRKSKFAAHFPGESNPRNTASGTAKRQSDYQKAQYLTVVAYQYLPDGVPLASKGTEINILQTNGFVVPPHYMAAKVEDAIAVYEDYVASKRAALDWEIDGLVCDVDDRDQREAMGSHNMRPNGARALKFPHAQAKTTLRAVIPQVGKSGRITPVAVFNTVKLAGANVSRASLHNPDYIDALLKEAGLPALTVGMEIMAERRNDVIPGVACLVSAGTGAAIHLPDECPECGTATERDGAYLVCPNSDTCPAQIAGAVKRWITKIGVKHFGTALIDHLCETGQVEQISDLYKLDPDTIAMQDDANGRKIGGTAIKAFRNLKAKDKTRLPLHVFIGSLGIPLIGRSMAKTIVDGGFDSLKAMTHAREAHIASIPGVGGTKAKAFLDGFWDLLDRGTVTSLLAHITIAEKATGVFSGKTICMTGFRDAQMVTAIEDQGGTVKSGVSKALTILVTKDPNSQSGKAAKARQYGTEIIGVDEMWNRLGGRP